MKTKVFLLGISFLALTSMAEAFELKTEKMGKLEVNGALSGYLLSGKRIEENAKETRIDIASTLISVSKKATPLGFTLMGGAFATPVIGLDTYKTSDNVDLFSPLPLAFLEVSPSEGLSISAGRMGTIIGYESPFTFQNNYLQRGLVWNMQPLFTHGIRLSYNWKLLSAKIGINDAYYSLGVDSNTPSGWKRKLAYALEGSLGITPVKDFSLSFNFLIPEKDARPNEAANPANKQQYNLIMSYTLGNFTLAGDLLYVYAPDSQKAQVPYSAKAYGGALHFSYDYAPFKLALRAEYVKDKKDKGGIDLVGLGENNRGYTLTFTPGYYKDPFFIRAEISYVKAKEDFADIKGGNPTRDSQTRVGFEVGLKF
ncbi:hypothetical protein THC_1367 [Caldimicrobium thiodismutans]|uniref:Porin n=1 Tax=Caldimicrobium thiodismutans TaxID=1653476 RepID=A0A0U5BY83_9BACT|nr:outer membrane beta-barrel protein [Caldimicrobium thiodismutans]BAU23733.1 hypothetical protein THC_1367 [Caldimicrobium thiodismutans]